MDGHKLHEEDLRLIYTFDQSSGSAAQYEAHSDSQVGFEINKLKKKVEEHGFPASIPKSNINMHINISS